MVASSSGSGTDKPEVSQTADVTEEGTGAQACEDSGALQFPENSRWRKPSRGRESGMVVRLFPNPPQIFGATQAQQQVGRDNDRYRECSETLAESELRPLEAEALSLSRMLKSLQPQEFSFPTTGLRTEPESPPSTPGGYSSRSMIPPTESTGTGVEGFGRPDDFTLSRSQIGVRLPVRDKNDTMHPFSTANYANTALSPAKSPESRRRTRGGFPFPSSRGSTPSSSIGSASELQFPVVLQSPSSPEPLRPGSPLKWCSKISPVEDTPVGEGVREMPVQGLVGRNPSFALYMTKNPSRSGEITRSDSEISVAVQKLQQQRYDLDEEDSLSSMLPPGLDPNNLDYSFATEYKGPPISHVLPKVNPLDIISVRSSEDEYISSPPVAPPSPVRASTPTSVRTGLTVAAPDNRITHTLFTSISVASDTGSDSGNSIPLSPRLKRPPKNRKANPHLRRPNSYGVSGEQDYGDIRPGSSSPEAGPLTNQRNRRNSSDYDHDSVMKGYSLSHSFRSTSETLTPSKSESGAMYKMAATPYSGNDSIRPVGQRPRSVSMPEAMGSLGGPTMSSSTNYDENDVSPRQRRKGECWLCRRGHWFNDKESCLVCNAKYCYNCVLTAMESMPEGRKCKHCIGKPVDDSRRASIGKPSRLLNKLLSPQEVQQIMKAEKECVANQLKPDQLWVNERQLNAEELSILLGCSNPPQKLKPGRYWYDQQSGLWGKDGERPDKLISPHLKVGGQMLDRASNGTTKIFMNGRELGKLELKMLKLAGVQCPPNTRLWVDPEGEYQEEGQQRTKGNIWKKTSIRILHPFFSLPTPGPNRSSKEDQRDSTDVYVPDYLAQNKLHKLLLLGHEGSGRSTIFKQTKFLFKNGFEPKDVEKMKAMIQRNIYRYARVLLEGRERFEEEDDDLAESESFGTGKIPGGRRSIYALDEHLKKQADYFLEVMAEGDLETFFLASSREYAPLVEELWKSSAIKATYKRKEELDSLPIDADYFLEKVMEFTSDGYLPSNMDILRAEGLAQGSGLAEVEFPLDEKVPVFQDADSSSPGRYQLIKVGGKGMAEGCKWLDMFEDVHAVIFCIAISEYDQVSTDSDGVLRSKLRQTELFDCVLKHPVLSQKPFVLLLNKYDLFEDKFCKDVPLTTCEWFSDFKPVGASQMTAQMQAQQAYTYVVHKYKELFLSGGHKLFTFKLIATEQEKVLEALQYVREILKWKDNNNWDCGPEESSYSTDLSSYSNPGYYAERSGKSLEL